MWCRQLHELASCTAVAAKRKAVAVLPTWKARGAMFVEIDARSLIYFYATPHCELTFVLTHKIRHRLFSGMCYT